MARDTYEEAMKHVLEHEGGYSNHPSDPGGPTNWGITIIDARLYWKQGATAFDVQRMPKSVAMEIYRKQYADKVQYDKLPPGVDYAVLDYGINSGISRAAKVLQRVLKVPVDGVIGTRTIDASYRVESVSLINAIQDERLHFLQGLKTWPVFGNGWGRRVREVRRFAVEMAHKYPKQLPPVPGDTMPTPHATPEEVERSAKAPDPGDKPIESKTILSKVIEFVAGTGVAIGGIFSGMDWRIGIALILVIAIGTFFVVRYRIRTGGINKDTWIGKLVGA